MAQRAAGASAGDGRSGKYRGPSRRFARIGVQAQRRGEGFGRNVARTRRDPRSYRRTDSDHSGCLVLLDLDLLAWDVIRELRRENTGPKTWARIHRPKCIGPKHIGKKRLWRNPSRN